MNNNPFDFFDEIYCINLDHRTDRWEHVQKEFEKLGIKDRIKRFSAIKHKDGRIGLIKSNLEILKKSKKLNSKNVLIFEDDVKIIWHNKPLDILKKSINQLKQFKRWDMFYFGANTHQKLEKTRFNNLVILKNAFATQSVCYNNNIYDDYINYAEKINKITKMDDILDVWISKNIQRNGFVYMTNPILTTQIESFSDIENRNVNYSFIEERFKKNIL